MGARRPSSHSPHLRAARRPSRTSSARSESDECSGSITSSTRSEISIRPRRGSTRCSGSHAAPGGVHPRWGTGESDHLPRQRAVPRADRDRRSDRSRRTRCLAERSRIVIAEGRSLVRAVPARRRDRGDRRAARSDARTRLAHVAGRAGSGLARRGHRRSAAVIGPALLHRVDRRTGDTSGRERTAPIGRAPATSRGSRSPATRTGSPSGPAMRGSRCGSPMVSPASSRSA